MTGISIFLHLPIWETKSMFYWDPPFGIHLSSIISYLSLSLTSTEDFFRHTARLLLNNIFILSCMGSSYGWHFAFEISPLLYQYSDPSDEIGDTAHKRTSKYHLNQSLALAFWIFGLGGFGDTTPNQHNICFSPKSIHLSP